MWEGRVTESLIDRVRERLAADAGRFAAGRAVARAIRAESAGLLGDTEVLSSLRAVQTELTGAGVLEPLLCAPGTTDVLVTSPSQVWIDAGNGLRRTPVEFADDAAVRRLASGAGVGRRLDDASPVDGLLADVGPRRLTVRVHAILAPVAAAGTCICAAAARARSFGAGRRRSAHAGRRGAVARDRGQVGVPGFRRHGCGQDHPALRAARGGARR
ncbi:hypothetical protein MMUR_00690 [Mycolicibacterium murale]|uniref:Conjugal transfer protein n=1 Tax=Mycolicibacterium murale TaxID=182220 RepID=A0A7I9WDY9_9MYCO|nr:hypothetical protein MMUR_00690 [Mycolicibacterium murale]